MKGANLGASSDDAMVGRSKLQRSCLEKTKEASGRDGDEGAWRGDGFVVGDARTSRDSQFDRQAVSKMAWWQHDQSRGKRAPEHARDSRRRLAR